MASAIAFAALALLASTPAKASDPPVLDGIFAFDDAAHCVPAPRFREFLDTWAAPRPGGGWDAGEFVLPTGYEDVLAYSERPHGQLIPMITEMWGNNGRHDVIASIQGSWHGLPVRYFTVWTGPPSTGTMMEIAFDAAPDRVAAVLSGLGFPQAEGGSGISNGAGVPVPSLSCRFR